jgi:hypothetical protein
MFRTFPACAGVLSACLLAVGCSSSNPGSSAVSSAPATAPVLTTISPATATAGSAGVTLTATGQNFVAGSELTWNGSARATLYQSSTSLQMALTSADLASAATAQVGVVDPQSAGSLSSNSIPFLISVSAAPNPAPVLSSVSPASASTGSAAITVTLTGSNFLASSVVNWNGQALSSSFQSATALTAQIPAADLANAGTDALSVANPAPGGGTSGSVNFLVNATGTSGLIGVSAFANDLAWDSVNQVIYLSLPSVSGSNGTSIQTLNPVSGALGASVFAGSEPNLLAVSSTSKYLYASLDGSSALQRFLLPSLTKDINLSLGTASFYGSYVAMDLQSSPVSDGTVAVVRGTPGTSPEEEGGVMIFDDSVQRPNVLCGWIEFGCNGQGADLFDSIQWNSTATAMYALNSEDTAFNFYSIPVTSSGFGTVKDYGSLAGGFYDALHYDAPTNLLYTNDGVVINPSTGTKAATFAGNGLVVPDGKLGLIFVLSSSSGGSTYTLQWFDINHYTLTGSMTLKSIAGTPTHLIRWGSNGLAFTTRSTTYTGSGSTVTGSVYLVSGTF